MIQYIYFVKCPGCEDEHFDFFDEAKVFALSCLSSKPIITQTEVNRNDFGECTDSCDLGTVWSWEDIVGTPEEEPTVVFSKDDIVADYNPDNDPEFQDDDFFASDTEDSMKPVTEEFDRVRAAAQCSRNCYDFYKAVSSKAPAKDIKKFAKAADKFVKDQYGLTGEAAEDLLWSGYVVWKRLHENNKTESCKRKSIPEGMTIESLVEEMEENEDTVECKSCEELFDKAACDYIEGHGWLCTECKDVLSTSSKLLPFKESTDNTEKAAELDDTILLYYKDLTVTVSGDEIPGGYYDPPEWEDVEYTDEYEYEVDTDEIAGVIYDKYLTDEDVPGGISTLDDDDVWEKFWIDNLEKLVEKYNSQLLDYYREDAEKDAYETFQERYDNEIEAARDDYYDSKAEEKYWRDRGFEI